MAKRLPEIYLADGNLSEMGPVTQIAEVPIDIGGHGELARLQVANVQNRERRLGRPWLKRDNLKIDCEEQKITFDREQCITWCLDKSATICYDPCRLG